MHARPLQADLVGTEKDLRCLEFLRAKLNDLTVRQVIVRRVLILLLLMVLDIEAYWDRNIALQLLDPLNDLKLSGCMENIAGAPQQKLEMLRHIATSKVNSLYRVRDGETFEDWTAMANAVSAIKDDARRLATSVETEHGLLLEEYLWRAKLLEKDVSRLHAIAVGVQGRLSEEDGVLLGGDLELVEDVPPELLHVIPVLNYTVLNWIVEFENASVFVLYLRKYR